jgi:SAM-dependent methyltransferase
MTARDPQPGSYALGATDDERERLVAQATLFDRTTERYLREAGLAPGMRVLDLGTGMGDVALTAASIVGGEGRVVGVERDADTVAAARARIDGLGIANVEIVEGDVTALEGVGGPEAFDAVIGRLVLIHVADPMAVLRDAAGRMRRGGLLVAMEYDAGWIPSHPPAALWDATVALLQEAFARAGVHGRMGLELLGAFAAAGLSEPELRSEHDVGGGGAWAGYAVLAETVRSLLPAIEATGLATAAEVDPDTLADRLRADVMATGGVAASPPLIGAWARVR